MSDAATVETVSTGPRLPRARTLLSILARIVLGVIFVRAGVYKLGDPDGFVGAVDWVSGIGLDGNQVYLLTQVLPRFELGLGLCLLLGLYLRPTLALTAITLLVFTGVLVVGAAAEEGILSCGCFGSEVLDAGGPTLWIARNAAMLLLALAALLFGRPSLGLDALARRRSDLPGA